MNPTVKIELKDLKKVNFSIQRHLQNFSFPDTNIRLTDGNVFINRIVIGLLHPFLWDSVPFNSTSEITILLPELTKNDFWANLSKCLKIGNTCNGSGDDTDLEDKEDKVVLKMDCDKSIDVDALIEEVEHILDVAQTSVDIGQNTQNIKTLAENFIESKSDKDTENQVTTSECSENQVNFKKPIDNDVTKNHNLDSVTNEMYTGNKIIVASETTSDLLNVSQQDNFSKDLILNKRLKEKMIFPNYNLAVSVIFSWCDDNLSPLIIDYQVADKIVLKCPHASQLGNRRELYEDRGCPVELVLTRLTGDQFILDRAEPSHQYHEVSYRLYRAFAKPRMVREIEDDKEGIIGGLIDAGFTTEDVLEYFSGYNTMDLSNQQIYRILKTLKKKRNIDINEDVFEEVITNQPNIPTHDCSSCYQEFSSNYILLAHMLQEHLISVPVKCPKCEVVSENVRTLRKHKTEVHTEPKMLSWCQICNKGVKHLKSHMKIHTSDTFGCNECDHKSNNEGNLQIHRRVHSDAKIFKCKVCEKAFKWKSSLNCHIEAAHSKSAPSFMCEEYSHPFKDKNNLAKHMFTHKAEKPHTCDKCGKGWIRLDFLKNHKCTANK